MKATLMILIVFVGGCSLITHTESRPVEFQVYVLNDPHHISRWLKALRADGYDTHQESENVINAIANTEKNEPYISLLFLSGDIRSECKSIAPILVRNFKIEEPRAHLNNTLEACHLGAEMAHLRFQTPFSLHITITGKLVSRFKYVHVGSVCRDGTISSSIGSGTCSWRGGVSGPYYRKDYLD